MSLRSFVAAAALFFWFLSGCQTTQSAVKTSRLDHLVADLHARGLFDGAIVVGDARGVIWEKGFGHANVEAGIRFSPDTSTDAASLAKTFTATLLIQLAREGALDLDAPAKSLLPELPYNEITLRHLVAHSSGLPFTDYEEFDKFLPPDQVRTTETLLEVISHQAAPLSFVPGTAFEYSNLGFDLAALAAARATGKPYGELLADRFFIPLGLGSAFLRPGRLDEFPGVRTLAYRLVDGELELHDVFDFEAFHGGSNIYISARDLHRWNASFLNGTILDSAVRQQAATPVRIGKGLSGLMLGSWYRSEDGHAFAYSGHHQGFHSEVFRDMKSRRSVVYVSNNTIAPWLQHALIRSINEILDGGESPVIEPPAVDDIEKGEHALLAGRWILPEGRSLAIDFTGGHLRVHREGIAYRAFAVGPRYFYVPGLDFMLGFAKDAAGTFTRVHVSSNFDEQWGVRLADASATLQ